MSRPDFDVLIVGARWAGAVLGTFGGRARARARELRARKRPLAWVQALGTVARRSNTKREGAG